MGEKHRNIQKKKNMKTKEKFPVWLVSLYSHFNTKMEGTRP